MKNTACILLVSCLLSTCSNQEVAIVYSESPVMEAIPFAAGIISTEDKSEFSLAFSPDGKTVYFSRRAPETKQKIYTSQWENNQWTTPKVAPFSTDRDETPFLTADGEYFFFGSERAIPGQPNKGNFDMNIWKMQRTEAGWSEPKPLPAPINAVQAAGEEWPSSNANYIHTHDGKTFYYTTMNRGDSAVQLYQTRMTGDQFSQPVKIEGLFENEQQWKYSAAISPDGQYLLFNSYGAPEGAGGEDIYIAQKTANGWSAARSLGPKINTKNEESNPRFSRDGKYFFFGRSERLSQEEYGEWSIYFIETEYLDFQGLF